VSVSSFIAKRYLRAHRKNRFLSFITTIAILGVMLGTAALIITLSILDGFEREIKEKVISFTSHIEIKGFQNHTLPDYQKSIAEVKSIQGVKAISPFAAREGMVRSREAVDGIYIKGIDVGNDVLTSRQHIVAGTFLSNDTSAVPPLVIGMKLANRLNVNVGDKIVIFALPREREQGMQARAGQFRIVGIYQSGMAEFDDLYAYTNLSAAQSLLQIGNEVTGYDVLVNDINQVDRITEDIQKKLGYPHHAQTVFQLYRNLFSWVELQKKMSPILLSLIILVATVNIVGTLLMFVLEKTHAIGILKSLGAGPKLIRQIFRLQGMAISVMGIVLGNLLAYGLCWLQLRFKIMSLPSDIYYMDTVPILLKPENFILVSIIAFVLCLLTTVLPARSAAKLDTVTALRFG
jgi:lipoprotein-releasing system permease protein